MKEIPSMKLQHIGLLVISIALVFSACSKKLTEEEYYNAAKNAYTEENYAEALVQFKNLIKNYPDGKRAAEASFMLGFINANDLKDYDAAKKYYEAFIEKYPDNELKDDAEYELKTLGKDINELPIFKDIAGDSLSQ